MEQIHNIPYRVLLLFIALFVCASTHSIAQDPPFYSYGVENGLPSNEVYETYVASNGYLWIGTDAGLVRFDGISFKIYTPNNEETAIDQPYEHPLAGMFAHTLDGRIVHVVGDSLEVLPFKEPILDYRFFGNDMYFLSLHSLFKSDYNFSHTDTLVKNAQASYYNIVCKGIILSSDGLNDFEGNIIYKNSFVAHNARQFMHKGLILNPYKSELFEYIPPGKLQLLPICKNFPSDLCVINSAITIDDENYLTTFCGAYSLAEKRYLFKEYSISDIDKDLEGNYWFSTLGDGILLVPHPQIKEYKRGNAGIRSRADHIIKTKIGQIYILGLGKIYVYNETKDYFDCVVELPAIKQFQSVLYDSIQNKLLFECGSLYEWDFKGKPKLISILNNKNILYTPYGYFSRSHGYYSLFKPGSGIFQNTSTGWLNTYLTPEYAVNNGYKNQSFRRDILEVESKAVTCTYLPKNDVFVFATQNELYELSVDGLHIVHVENKDIKATVLEPDNQGSYFFADKNLGIFQTKPGQKPKQLISAEKYGLKKVIKMNYSDSILSVLTSTQFLTINLKTNEVDDFSSNSEIGFYEFRNLYTDDQFYWLITNKSVLKIPKNLHLGNNKPPLLLGVDVYYKDKQITGNEEFEFPYVDNDFVLKFQGIQFRNKGNFEYRVFLKGYDKEEQIIYSQNPEFRYKKLPPGKYELIVYAQNAEGKKSRTFSYKFMIRTPFWQQIWFYVLLVLIVAAISYFIGFAYVKNIQKRNRMQTTLLESRLTSIKAQMNPHFIFNALGSIQYLVLEGQIKNANTYLGKFSRLMRRVLESSDLVAVSLADEIQMLNLYLELEKLRMGENFSYKIHLSPQLFPEQQKLPPLLLQPFVENAIRHGLLHKQGEKKLEIEFIAYPEKNIMECIIDDNGIGREASTKINQASARHVSFSSKANNARLQLYNEKYPGFFDLYYDDKPKQGGTRVIVKIPLNFEG